MSVINNDLNHLNVTMHLHSLEVKVQCRIAVLQVSYVRWALRDLVLEFQAPKLVLRAVVGDFRRRGRCVFLSA